MQRLRHSLLWMLLLMASHRRLRMRMPLNPGLRMGLGMTRPHWLLVSSSDRRRLGCICGMPHEAACHAQNPPQTAAASHTACHAARTASYSADDVTAAPQIALQ